MSNRICAELFGLYPGSKDDCSFAAYKSVEACRNINEPVLVIPKGTYHFYPDKAFEKLYCISNHGVYELKRIAFPLIGFEKLTVDGQGSEFVFHGKIIPFIVDGSKNVKIKNLSISWELPMNIQGEVLAAGEDFVEVKILEQNSYKIENGKIILKDTGWEEKLLEYSVLEIDVNRKAPAYLSGDQSLGTTPGNLTATEIGPNLIRLEGKALKRKLGIGNMLVFRAGWRYAPAIFINNSADVIIEGVNIYSAIGMGVIAQLSENITVKNVNVTYQPGTDRLFTLNADAVQFVNCRGLMEIEGCLFEGQLDDAVNTHGIYTQINECLDAHTLLVKLVHYEQKGIMTAHPGDKMRIVHYDSLKPYWSGTVRDVKQVNIDYTILCFEEELPEGICEKDVVENITWNPDLIVRNCKVRNNRARGFLIATRGKVLIENNEISSSGAAILMGAEAVYWFESSPAQDVTVRNNVFDNCCFVTQWGKVPIMIIPDALVNEDCLLRNISIENNLFRCYDMGILQAKLVDGLKFTGNKVELTDVYPRHGENKNAFELIKCKNIIISDNVLPKEFESIDTKNCDEIVIR